MNVMNRLFNQFEQEQIAYLHFKSNGSLAESFAGKGDFDVLVDRTRQVEIERILLDCGAKRHNTIRYGNYPGVDNWMVFDDVSGILFHLHLHYQIATGKRLVKDYILPFSELLFEERIKDETHGIYITPPSFELILLTIRSVLKAHLKDYVLACLGLYQLHGSLNRERKELLSQCDEEKVSLYISRVIPQKYETDFKKLALKNTIKGWQFLKLSRIVRQSMKCHRRMNGMLAGICSVKYRVCDLANKFVSKKMGKPRIVRKTANSGGYIIAFVGVDGSGKSTTTGELQKWIVRKIECMRFYMGTGDGHTTLFAKVLKTGQKMLEKSDKGVPKPKKTERIYFHKHPLKYIKKLLTLQMIYSVEKNNYKKMLIMQRYRLNGGICLLDRYPQIESPGINDGPKAPGYVTILGDNWYTRRMVKLERKKLEIVKTVKPDLVFRLNITPEISVQRKEKYQTAEKVESARQKIEKLNAIHFQHAKIIDIDATKPYEEELLQIKRILWQYI